MGCDIHLYKEKMIDREWVTADEVWCDEYNEGLLDVPYEKRFSNRDYDLFGFLASGVRRNHKYSFAPRGIPFDVCEQVQAQCDRWDCDGHSHSYLMLSELKNAINFLNDKTIEVSGMMDKGQLDELRTSIASDGETDWGLLYPYCGWASNSNYIEFSVDVPALIQLNGIQEIIDLFNGIDGENHRIVFWFDN